MITRPTYALACQRIASKSGVRLIAFCVIASLTLVSAKEAFACSVVHMSDAEKKSYNQDLLKDSAAVQTGKHCSFINGGLLDITSAGSAIALGKERFYQVLNTQNGFATDILVVDCQQQAATRLVSGVVRNANYIEDSCGSPHGDRHPIVAPKGPLTLEEGNDLYELEDIAKSTKKVEEGELEHLIYDRLGNRLPDKDRIDFFCGCRLFHPESKVAQG